MYIQFKIQFKVPQYVSQLYTGALFIF